MFLFIPGKYLADLSLTRSARPGLPSSLFTVSHQSVRPRLGGPAQLQHVSLGLGWLTWGVKDRRIGGALSNCERGEEKCINIVQGEQSGESETRNLASEVRPDCQVGPWAGWLTTEKYFHLICSRPVWPSLACTATLPARPEMQLSLSQFGGSRLAGSHVMSTQCVKDNTRHNTRGGGGGGGMMVSSTIINLS